MKYLLTIANIDLMISGIKLLEPRLNGLYNPLFKLQNINTYFGENHCGEACFILKFILESKNYNVNIFKVENKMNKLYNDHLYLKIDNIIIDPTYKLFLQSDYSINNRCQYTKVMQLDLMPVFIGKKKELLQTINTLNALHNEIYTKDLHIYDYWLDSNNHKFNIDYINVSIIRIIY